MSSEKNNSLISTRIKSVAVKRRIVEPKDELKKEAVQAPKKSKLAVRITGRDLKVEAREEKEPVKHHKAEEVSESGRRLRRGPSPRTEA